MLSQLDEEEREVVIAYHSRSMNVHERRYKISEMEGLLIVFGVRKNRHFLLGHPFIVKTNHQLLTFLQNLEDKSGRLIRWAILLSEYTFDIEYRKGINNTVPDALSRIYHKANFEQRDT